MRYMLKSLWAIIVGLTASVAVQGQGILSVELAAGKAFTQWCERGEFEKSADHAVRLERDGVAAFDSICERLLTEKLSSLVYRQWKFQYDADGEFFWLKSGDQNSSRTRTVTYVNGVRYEEQLEDHHVFEFRLDVPIGEARKFKEDYEGNLVAWGEGRWWQVEGRLTPERMVFEAIDGRDAFFKELDSAMGSPIVIRPIVGEKELEVLKGHVYEYYGVANGRRPADLFASGTGWSLKGRSAISVPSPSSDAVKEGKMIVKIWVNQEGTVTKAEAPVKGSTIVEQPFVDSAKNAAMKARFSADQNADWLQVGYITYVWRSNN